SRKVGRFGCALECTRERLWVKDLARLSGEHKVVRLPCRARLHPFFTLPVAVRLERLYRPGIESHDSTAAGRLRFGQEWLVSVKADHLAHGKRAVIQV